MSYSKKYMIGDKYGNMWAGKEDEFQCVIGRIFGSKKEASDAKEMLLDKYSRLEEHVLKIWVLDIIEDEDECSDDFFIDVKPRKSVKVKGRIISASRYEEKIY